MQHSVTFYLRRSRQICYSLLVPVFRYWANSDGDISDFRISGQSLIKGNCHNSRTKDNDIDMKLGAVTKIDKRNKTKSCQKIETSLTFSQFTVSLVKSRSWIPDAWSGSEITVGQRVMTGQILPFDRPEFSVITKWPVIFFLNNWERLR